MRRSLGRILAVVRKEGLQLARDRLTFGMVFGVPIVQLLLFGYAINQDVRHLGAAVVDLAATQRSRVLVADAAASQVVDVVATAGSAEELEGMLRRGEIVVGILIPHDFERRVARRDRPAAHLLVDGSDPVVLAAARRLAAIPLPRDGPPPEAAPDAFAVRAYYNPERRSPVQIVPGLVGVIPFWLATFVFVTVFIWLFERVMSEGEPEGGAVRAAATAVIQGAVVAAAVTWVFREIFLVNLP